MINEKDILAMLQNGENADDIARKLIDTLVKGRELYEEELAVKAKADAEAKAKADAEAKAKAKAILDAKKEEDMSNILDSIYRFIFKYYCETDEDVTELNKAFKDLTAKNVINSIEGVGSLVVETMQLFDNINLPDFNVAIKNKTEKQPDDIFKSFFKSIGL